MAAGNECRARVQVLLKEMAAGPGCCQQVCENIAAEENLPEEVWCTWADNLDGLSHSDRSDATRLMQEVANFCGQHILKGPAAALGPAAELGSVIPKATFHRHIEAHLLITPGALEKKWATALKGNPIEFFRESCTDVPVKKGLVMWSTFNEMAHDEPPFADIEPLVSQNVCDVLGLAPHMTEAALLLFRYSLPTGCRASKPTIADAYFGNPAHWNGLFRPSPSSSGWGRTSAPAGYNGHPSSKPEVVHSPIKGAHITGVDELLP